MVAQQAGFAGVCLPEGAAAAARRSHLLLVLSSRSIVYADAACADALRDLVLAFLDGGGHSGLATPRSAPARSAASPSTCRPSSRARLGRWQQSTVASPSSFP